MSDDERTSPSGESVPPASTPMQKLLQAFKQSKIDAAMLATRLITILFTLSYILPIFSNQQSSFNRVLLANAATSALRLHQRLPSFTFSREFLAQLFVEDSCHYLWYSLIFFSVQPTLLILIPIVLFAVLHASSYSLKLLDVIGQNSWWGARFIISLVEFQAVNILKAAAFSEIFVMVLSVVLAFMPGNKASLMTPIVYYHFLVMRYRSKRNPYTRNAFTELRIATQALAQRSPPIVQKILYKAISLISHLAPQPTPASPPPPPQQTPDASNAEAK